MGHGAFAPAPAMGEGGCVLDLEREEDPKVLRQATKILIHENERLLEPP
jgi:hypothetical protein